MTERKNTTIQFRATTKEKELLKEISKSLGYSISDLIRHHLNNTPIITRPDQSSTALLEEVSNIGNDFNRMVRLMESGKILMSRDVRFLCSCIQKLLIQLEQQQ